MHRRFMAVLASAIGALALSAASSALADQYTVYSCHDPAGHAVGDDGWSQNHIGGTFIVMDDTCTGSGEGALVSELPGRSGGYSNVEGGTWQFAAPSGVDIARYTLHVGGSYAQPLESGGAGSDDVIASDESDPSYDFRNLAGGAKGAVIVTREPPDAVNAVDFTASCDSGCGYGAQAVARIDVSSAAFLLTDVHTPKVSGLSGTLESGKTLSGIVEASYEASESAPGIYGAHFIVDGQAQPTELLDAGQSTCTDLGQSEDGTRAFDAPEPCASVLTATSDLDTASWPDGEHHVQLVVEDAAGNAVTAFNAMVTFHNAPSANSEPTRGALGTSQSPLGSLSTGSGYPPASVELTGTAARWANRRDGLTRSYPKSALTLSGRLVSPSGSPVAGQTVYLLAGPPGTGLTAVAHAVTDANGAWTLRAPKGASRLLRVSYGAQQAAAAGAQYSSDIAEHVRPAVTLHISSYGDGILAFRGRVRFASVRPALLAVIQARAHGHWQDVGAPQRVNAAGLISARYSASPLIGRTYSFRLLVPGTRQSSQAASRTVTATVR